MKYIILLIIVIAVLYVHYRGRVRYRFWRQLSDHSTFTAPLNSVHQKNGGLSAARNTGLERAKGTYLCFVDSDDLLDSRMLETLLSEMV